MEFKNTDVAAKYESLKPSDPVVHLPGKKGTGFRCKMSDLNIEQADKLFADPGQNFLKIKEGATQSNKSKSSSASGEKPVTSS